MMIKNLLFSAVLIFLITFCSNSNEKGLQSYRLIGSCEGCEAIFEYGDKKLTAVDTLPDFNEPGPRLKITGTVYKQDGKTPAADVILYVYHTDQNGLYTSKEDAGGWGRRHGYIRGWVKTGADGRYTFYTLKPGIYPSRSQPAHIHPVILEPNGKYYWLGSYFFSGDTLLNNDQISPINPRAGSPGIVELKQEDDLWLGTRDFILGKNVPDYDK
jgi:protocatechuate 3,4-dioxygenase beta subunit